MAEAGSFAERVKQQADIVRVIGEYVRLKKSGQNFTGLCPFHAEKSPSFAVHPVKQIYHCFGCGVGGDVFKFVMEVDKVRVSGSDTHRGGKMRDRYSAAARSVRRRSAKKISNARCWWRCTAKRRHFLCSNWEARWKEKRRAAYLEDRGLDKEAMARFGIGYAPSGGDALLRFLKSKYPKSRC